MGFVLLAATVLSGLGGRKVDPTGCRGEEKGQNQIFSFT